MPKASRDSLNAKGKRDVYMFDPEDLVIVTDERSPLYDERAELPLDEGLVLNMMFAPDGVPQGVLEPVLVTRNAETGAVEVVDGRQRVKSAREANKRLKVQGLEPIRVPGLVQRANAHRLMCTRSKGSRGCPRGKATMTTSFEKVLEIMGTYPPHVFFKMGVETAEAAASLPPASQARSLAFFFVSIYESAPEGGWTSAGARFRTPKGAIYWKQPTTHEDDRYSDAIRVSVTHRHPKECAQLAVRMLEKHRSDYNQYPPLEEFARPIHPPTTAYEPPPMATAIQPSATTSDPQTYEYKTTTGSVEWDAELRSDRADDPCPPDSRAWELVSSAVTGGSTQTILWFWRLPSLKEDTR